MPEPTDIPEITPQAVSEDIDLFLTITGPERDGLVFTAATFTEGDARSALSNYSGDWNRFATIVRVKVPRAMLKERWKAAER